ncbi:hypothetical protein ACTJKK_16210 [Microbacterium sp. 22179]|uniref:hypothetical protein n=1 Tax=Microbacterium sp. 22179 TaxID=3453886 RepID=UPI003F8352C9|nr:hypothetical protein [Microbacterium sp.]
MSDGLPEGWLPTPFGVDEAEAPALAAALTRIAADTLPGFIDGDDARTAMAATIARAPIAAGTVGRVWHVLGAEATGAIVDLSVIEGDGPVPDSPFAHTVPQRDVVFPEGRAALSLVAPREHVPVAMLLRAQRQDGGRTLVADAIDAAPVLGLVLDDVIALVGGTPPGSEGLPSGD